MSTHSQSFTPTSTAHRVLELIQSLIPHIQTQAERDQAYLNESVDVYDLERRMREVDDRSRGCGMGLGQACDPFMH